MGGGNQKCHTPTQFRPFQRKGSSVTTADMAPEGPANSDLSKASILDGAYSQSEEGSIEEVGPKKKSLRWNRGGSMHSSWRRGWTPAQLPERGDLELYLHGLAEGDFDLALRGLLGEDAPLSKPTIRRLKAMWAGEFEAWNRRSLKDREVVYVWVDGIYVKAGLEREKAALLVVIGAMSDGTKEVLALTSGYRESTESWAAVFRDLMARGLGEPQLLVADGNAGIWAAAAQVWPRAEEQRCWNHKIRNVLDRLPKKLQGEAKELLRAIAYAPSLAEALKAREAFSQRYGSWYPKAVETLEDDWDRMVTFYGFPESHWKHLRTTNIVESPFASVRLRTSAAKRFKRVENATALIWKLMGVAEKQFRKLDAPHQLKDVFEGRKFEDGKPVLDQQRKEAA